jgi:hypothetical protein
LFGVRKVLIQWALQNTQTIQKKKIFLALFTSIAYQAIKTVFDTGHTFSLSNVFVKIWGTTISTFRGSTNYYKK